MPAHKTVSDAQLERLVVFMEAHTELAKGQVGNHGPLAKQNTQKLWEELSLLPNSMGSRHS